MSLLRAAAGFGILIVAAVAFNVLVVRPFRLNLAMGNLVVEVKEAPSRPHRLRQSLEHLSASSSDPYLTGGKCLLQAQVLRRLGRFAESRRKYDCATRGRIGIDGRIEAALYHWEHGDRESAEELLLEVVRYSPDLTSGILEPHIQQDLEEKARVRSGP